MMKKISIKLAFMICVLLVSCQPKKTQTAQDASFLISNISDSASKTEVMNDLQQVISAKSVAWFFAAVEDYNDTIKRTSLTKGFVDVAPEYDVATISELWKKAKGLYIGTNCRITAFTLLGDSIQIPSGEYDDALLFLDNDAIVQGGLFTEEETARFRQLFSRVPTDKTTDVRVHAEKMQDYFSQFAFNSKAKMLSVVLHDNLDGDYLFVGHIGVLVENASGFLFIEKLSFEEPYQAVKFKTVQDCVRYLQVKYEHYHDEETAKPFVMINGKYTE